MVTIALLSLGLVAVTGLAFVLTNLMARPTPAPLWTAADLPALPPAADNGWTVLQVEGSGDDFAAIGEANAALKQALEATSVADARTALSEMRMLAAKKGPATERCANAFEKQHLAYACTPHPNDKCRVIPFHQCHAWWLTQLLVEQTSSDPQPIAERFNRQLDKDQEIAHTASTLLGQKVVARALTDTVDVALWLNKHRPEALKGVKLERLKGRMLNVKNAAIGEYMFSTAAIEMVSSEDNHLLYDTGATLQLLNEAHEPARNGDYSAIALPPRPTFWWWHNPVGWHVIELTVGSGADHYRSLEQEEQQRRERAAQL